MGKENQMEQKMNNEIHWAHVELSIFLNKGVWGSMGSPKSLNILNIAVPKALLPIANPKP